MPRCRAFPAVLLLLLQGTAAGQAERGEYLVKHVAMCVQCHSPRNSQGELIQRELFLGAPIPVKSPESWPEAWAIRAPRIAGLPQFTRDQFIQLLQTGKRPDGTPLKRPMPPFRMTSEDAGAIDAYLRSVNSSRAR